MSLCEYVTSRIELSESDHVKATRICSLPAAPEAGVNKVQSLMTLDEGSELSNIGTLKARIYGLVIARCASVGETFDVK
jgi:hypothetical protein